ncbi:hypothetical protein [Pedobacter xixiisoli]|nr:hypothetical protein [Pedobacter xixiisoli]
MRKITLCYRKIISVNSMSTWERLVFTDSFTEFKMQSQYYNQKGEYNTFAELKHHVPNAEQLHFLVSGAVMGYIRQLDDLIPDVTNNLGLHFLKFNQFRFEIINSDLRNIDKHVVAINFYSEELQYIEQIGDYLLTSKINPSNSDNEPMLTDMFVITPYLTIYTIQQ